MADRPGDAFGELLTRVRPDIDRRLDQRCERLERAVAPLGAGPTVQALRDLVRRGGKRFRPALTVAAYAGLRPKAAWDPALDAGVALELFHAYLLVQDDWMDGDATRRGGPSVHAALSRRHGSRTLGSCSAILASDFAWGLAVQSLCETDAPGRSVRRAIELLCLANQDVLVGQQLDLLGDRADGGALATAPDIELVHALKTSSYTVQAPLLIGAALAGAPERTMRALERFAQPLGVAFQLRDDLLGVFAGPDSTGKRLGSDLCAGKRTAVTLAGEACLDAPGRRAVARVFGHGRAPASMLVSAAEHLERCGARKRVEQRLRVLCTDATRRVRRLPLSREARDWLAGAVALVEQPVPRLAPGTATRGVGRRAG